MEKVIEQEILTLIKENKLVEALGKIDGEDEASLYYKALVLFNMNKPKASLMNIEKGMEISKTFYYDFILLKVQNYLNLDMKKEALKTLEEELSMPYIPKEYDKKFNDLYAEITKEIRSNSKSYSPFDMLDEDELKEELLKMNSKNLIFLINQLTKRNVRSYMKEIKKLLISDIQSMYKSIILETLCDQGISEEVVVKKNDLELTLVPSNLKHFIERESFENINKLLNSLNEEKNVSLDETMTSLLVQYLGDIYPLDVDEDEESLVALAIYIVANDLFGYKLDVEKLASKHGVNEEILVQYIENIKNINKTFMS